MESASLAVYPLEQKKAIFSGRCEGLEFIGVVKYNQPTNWDLDSSIKMGGFTNLRVIVSHFLGLKNYTIIADPSVPAVPDIP